MSNYCTTSCVFGHTHMSLIRARPIRMEGSAFDFQCMLSPSHVVSKRSKRPDFA